MSVYKSDNVELQASAEDVYNKLSNLENLRSLLEKVPADQVPSDKREMFDSIQITPDTISVPAGPVGNLTFRVTDKTKPSLIRLQAEGSPVPLSLEMNIRPQGEEACNAQVTIDIKLPPMLAPMVGGHIQKMADQFGQVLKAIPFS